MQQHHQQMAAVAAASASSAAQAVYYNPFAPPGFGGPPSVLPPPGFGYIPVHRPLVNPAKHFLSGSCSPTNIPTTPPPRSCTSSPELVTTNSNKPALQLEIGINSNAPAIHVPKKMAVKHNIICANCGGLGHGYKICNHPIISYGVICYRFCFDPDTNTISPRYLMVQRKDSLCYVEFIRGKYDLQNKDYILKLFENMTEMERSKITLNTFEALWNDMWCRREEDKAECSRSFSKEYRESHDKFNMLRRGFYIKLADSDDMILLNFNYIFENSQTRFDDTEWGFPKGRRNIAENDISCALREFAEETGISSKTIRLCNDIKPLEETFSGSNKIRYKHVYYVGKYVSYSLDSGVPLPAHFNPDNKVQSKEIKDVRWFTYQEAMSLIREHNVERRELLKRLNATIMKSIT
jgi:8-oxo-dGTP pyrophosphatase MutT (NUDIX family)